MNCPECNKNNDIVYGHKDKKNDENIKRYRKCLSCGHKFITVEKWNGK